ncbi:hypothetical protein LQF12_06665 [Ruania suaedae]|uniref:hypothetical protein n=1 Tax=Ruania suaedae TaxID=2897774 RepID=UPI001E5BFE4D|nr:hypothetical protein [Ruania suaedae]UFU04258.1 hypothetical protein LQF12_06665 [Ruania suaedae]
MIWPYFGATAEEPLTLVEPSATVANLSLMQAFGATESEAMRAASVAEDLVDKDAVTAVSDEVPDALDNTDPVRIERSENGALVAAVSVYADGSLGLSLVQSGPIDDPSDTIVEFDSASVDFSEIADNLSEARDEMAASGDISIQSTPSGCNSLPSQNGWIRRADCFIYDSMTPPVVSGSFYFDYSVKSGAGRVDQVYPSTAQQWCGPSTPTNSSLTINRSVSSGSAPARADHRFNCDLGPTSVPQLQTIWVLTSAWSTHNFNRD